MSNPFEVQSGDVAVVSENSKVRLKRVGVLSTAVFLAVAMAAMGLLGAMFFGLMILSQLALGVNAQAGGAEMFGSAVFLVILPVMYGVMGFIGGAINAILYNLIAGITGGIALELTPDH